MFSMTNGLEGDHGAGYLLVACPGYKGGEALKTVLALEDDPSVMTLIRHVLSV